MADISSKHGSTEVFGAANHLAITDGGKYVVAELQAGQQVKLDEVKVEKFETPNSEGHMVSSPAGQSGAMNLKE